MLQFFVNKGFEAFFIPASNEPSGHTRMSIWRLPRGSNTPMLASGYLTVIKRKENSPVSGKQGTEIVLFSYNKNLRIAILFLSLIHI